MGQKVVKSGIAKEKNFLYFVDREGDIARVEMNKGNFRNKSKKSPEKIKRTSITKEKGFLYYIDSDGDISKAAMMRGRN